MLIIYLTTSSTGQIWKNSEIMYNLFTGYNRFINTHFIRKFSFLFFHSLKFYWNLFAVHFLGYFTFKQ